MASATPDLRLPFQPQNITAPWPVPNYTAWWQRHMGANNLPGVASQQCTGRESNLRPLDHKSNALLLHYQDHMSHLTNCNFTVQMLFCDSYSLYSITFFLHYLVSVYNCSLTIIVLLKKYFLFDLIMNVYSCIQCMLSVCTTASNVTEASAGDSEVVIFSVSVDV